MWNASLDESQAGIKIARRNINNLRYADDTTLMAESKEELKSFLMKVKESEKVGFKLNNQKTKITASDPITSWQIGGANSDWSSDVCSSDLIEKAREFQKNIYFCFIDYSKAFDCVDHNKL